MVKGSEAVECLWQFEKVMYGRNAFVPFLMSTERLGAMPLCIV